MSAWWAFKGLQRLVDLDYKYYNHNLEKERKQVQVKLERQKALHAYEGGNIYDAQNVLSKHTYSQLDLAMRN